MAKIKVKAETGEHKDSFSETCSGIISGVISFFLFLLVTVFPLVYHDSYYDILETKYCWYYGLVVGMLAVVVVLSIIMLVIDQMENQGGHAVRLFAKLKPKNWRSTFCAADAMVMVFWLVLVISTLQSEYFYESFWGNEGRYSGLFLLTLYVAAYFVISRFWTMKGWVLEAFLISGLIVCYIGITDYFQLDVLHFRSGNKALHPDQSTIFTSTMGNINTYTAYVALIMGVATAMFTTAKKPGRVVWYYICMVVTFFAIIMGCSDNAYLALGALFAFLPLALFRSRMGIKRYLLVLATFSSVIQCIDIINQVYSEVVIGLDSLFKILVNFSGLMYVVVALWLVYIAVVIFDRNNREAAEEMGSIPVRVWSGLLVTGVLLLCCMLYDANVAGGADKYGALGNYLVFNDSWGTNRGYIWRKSVEMFRDFPVLQKLFGYGPETFGILTRNSFLIEMVNTTGQKFDSAHNEYLQYLVTIGALGVVSYVAFLVLAGWRMAVKMAKNEYMIGCLFAVLCYGFQAVVNLNLPIATPIMWLLLSIGMAACRGDEEKKYESKRAI